MSLFVFVEIREIIPNLIPVGGLISSRDKSNHCRVICEPYYGVGGVGGDTVIGVKRIQKRIILSLFLPCFLIQRPPSSHSEEPSGQR